MLVLFDGARSAEPPISDGILSAIALMTSPEYARVALASASSNVGKASSQSAGKFVVDDLFENFAFVGEFFGVIFDQIVPFSFKFRTVFDGCLEMRHKLRREHKIACLRPNPDCVLFRGRLLRRARPNALLMCLVSAFRSR